MNVPEFLKYLVLSGNASFETEGNFLQLALQKAFNEVWDNHIRQYYTIISYFRIFDKWYRNVLDEKVNSVIPLEEYVLSTEKFGLLCCDNKIEFYDKCFSHFWKQFCK